MTQERSGRGAYVRLSREEKGRFLEVLSQTGNRKAAAEAVGIEARSMDQRRAYDPLLDRDWRAALEMAHRRLSGADGPFDCPSGAKLDVVKRGRGGRLQLAASGPKRWNKAVEDRFVAALETCGCLAAAARAVGFSMSCVHQRRKAWPAFERRIQEALDEAELMIEFRCALDAGGFAGPFEGAGSDSGQRPSTSLGTNEAEAGSGTVAGDHPRPFDREFALRFLKWREEKRRGGGARGRAAAAAPAVPVEAVVEDVMRRFAAIRRHEARGGRAPDGSPEGPPQDPQAPGAA
ncbi:MAG TPA: hypothetical protein VF552_11550 [Allosphingosinicella sp.]|jgi:hypothetical protein